MFKKSRNEDQLDKLAEKMLLDLQDPSLTSEEADSLTQRFATIQALINKKNERRMSVDTKAMIAANLAGLLLILSYERTHIIGSKALSFVTKLR